MAALAGEAVQRVSKITEKVRKYVENHNFLCPISKHIMAEPVFAADGHTYEYEAIRRHLETDNRSPLRGPSLGNRELIINQGKKGEILEYLRKHPELYDEDEVYLPTSWIIGLVAAIKANRIKEVQEYLARDRRLLTLKLERDYTVFHLAAEFGSKELTDNLLGSFIRENVLDKLPKPPADFKPIYLNKLLEKSLIEADKDKFSLLLKLGAELNQIEEGTQNTLLHKLAIQGNPEPVKWLLERGISIEDRNVEGNTPLLLAVLHSRLEITWPLLDKKANPEAKNNQNQSAIAVALLKKNTTLLKVLVGSEKAALPPLHLALALNDIDLLKALLKQDSAKTSLEALDPMGQTPFYALMAKGSKEMKEKEEVARMLLEAGVDTTVACGGKKLTALHLVAEQGDLSLFKLLLTTKAATLIDAEDSQGNTPLHLAAKAGQDELVTALLEAGADHEVRNHVEAPAETNKLLENKKGKRKKGSGPARITENHQGQTPVDLARSQNKTKTVLVITHKVRALKRAQIEEARALRQLVKEQAIEINHLKETLQSQQTLFQIQQSEALKRLQKKVELLEQEKDQVKKRQLTEAEQLKELQGQQEAQNDKVLKPLQKKLEVFEQQSILMQKRQSTEIKQLQELQNQQIFFQRQQESALRPLQEKVETLEKEQSTRIEQLEKEMTKFKLKQKKRPKKNIKDQGGSVASSPCVTPQYKGLSSKPTLTKLVSKVTVGEVQKFLTHVARGEQNEAEGMLKQKPELALAAGTVTDHAKRTFKNVTGFQYAVWALDWQMWRMIRKYLPTETAQEQARSFTEGSWVKEYGEHVEWKKLTEAYQTLIGNFTSWSWEKVNGYWIQEIGGAQILLPMHILQEYTQPERPLSPCPKFDAEYTLVRDKLGFDLTMLGRVGVMRGIGPCEAVSDWNRCYDKCSRVQQDSVALNTLFSTRTQQRATLVAELVKQPGASPRK